MSSPTQPPSPHRVVAAEPPRATTAGGHSLGNLRILDVLPLRMLLLAIAFKERTVSPRGTILFGVAVHAYGIFVWNVLGFVA